MELLFIAGIALLCMSAAFLLGSVYANRQVQRHRTFHSSFKRGAVLLAIVTVLLALPAFAGIGFSAAVFTDAYQTAYGSYSLSDYVLNYTGFILDMFVLFAVPFYAGMWHRYRKPLQVAEG